MRTMKSRNITDMPGKKTNNDANRANIFWYKGQRHFLNLGNRLKQRDGHTGAQSHQHQRPGNPQQHENRIPGNV